MAFIDYFSVDECAHDEISQFITNAFTLTTCIVRCEEDIGDGFGRHVIFEANTKLTFWHAQEMTAAIVEAIGMTCLSSEMLSITRNDYGLIQPITESHISVHQVGDWLYLDVFSCRDFSERVLCEVVSRFVPDYKHYTVTRGFEMENKIL